jgi:ubiquinone/menaquinone biosynthesis C-methylase UbiE
MSNQKKWTGERLETFITGETMTEHLHRYAMAMDLVKEKTVLDIACGEGYGTNLLAQHAAHVTGIDIDTSTVTKAKNKYTSNNIVFKTGSVLNIPAEDKKYDIITCFETLEHVSEHDTVLKELKRVLIPGGILLISTPEKLNYSDIPNYTNPYHKKELYGSEFKSLLIRFFNFVRFYEQSSLSASVIIDEKIKQIQNFVSGDYNTLELSSSLPVRYWLAAVSDNELPHLPSSLFKNQKTASQLIEEHTASIKKTITYRTGNIILLPFKFIHSLFSK